MKIHAISDLHGFYPELPGGDLLIVGGDLTGRDTLDETDRFDYWLSHQSYKKTIFIAGNHDNLFSNEKPKKYMMGNKNIVVEKFEYLCNSGTEYEGLKIWGSPNSLLFHGVNPKCKAFMKTEQQLQQIYKEIPSDIDILITHIPSYGILDKNAEGENCGSVTLRNMVLSRDRFPNLKLHCFGHLHEQGGDMFNTGFPQFVNCSHVNEHYEPVNNYIEIEL